MAAAENMGGAYAWSHTTQLNNYLHSPCALCLLQDPRHLGAFTSCLISLAQMQLSPDFRISHSFHQLSAPHLNQLPPQQLARSVWAVATLLPLVLQPAMDQELLQLQREVLQLAESTARSTPPSKVSVEGFDRPLTFEQLWQQVQLKLGIDVDQLLKEQQEQEQQQQQSQQEEDEEEEQEVEVEQNMEEKELELRSAFHQKMKLIKKLWTSDLFSDSEAGSRRGQKDLKKSAAAAAGEGAKGEIDSAITEISQLLQQAVIASPHSLQPTVEAELLLPLSSWLSAAVAQLTSDVMVNKGLVPEHMINPNTSSSNGSSSSYWGGSGTGFGLGTINLEGVLLGDANAGRVGLLAGMAGAREAISRVVAGTEGTEGTAGQTVAAGGAEVFSRAATAVVATATATASQGLGDFSLSAKPEEDKVLGVQVRWDLGVLLGDEVSLSEAVAAPGVVVDLLWGVLQLLHEVVEWEEEQREVGEVLGGKEALVREWVREWEKQQKDEEKQEAAAAEGKQEKGKQQQQQELQQQEQKQLRARRRNGWGQEHQQQAEQQQQQEEEEKQQQQRLEQQAEQQREQQEAPMSTAATAAVNEAFEAVACWLPGWYELSLQLLPSLEPLDLMKVMNCIQGLADLGRWKEVKGEEGGTVAENSTGSSSDSSSSSSSSGSGMASTYVPSMVLLPFPSLGWVVAAVARLHTSRTALSAEAWLDVLQALAVVTRSHPGYTLLVGSDWVASLMPADAAATGGTAEPEAGGEGAERIGMQAAAGAAALGGRGVEAAAVSHNGTEAKGVKVDGLVGSSSSS